MKIGSSLLLSMRRARTLACMLAATIGGGVAVSPLGAQTPDTTAPNMDFRVGLYGAYQITQHDATLGSMPGVPTCAPGFTGPSGSGSAFGALAHYALSDLIALQIKLGYSASKGKFIVTEEIGNAVENGQVVNALSEHTIDFEIGMIDLEPRLAFKPFHFPLSFAIGAQIGLVQDATYDQKESLIAPTAATFAGGRAVRNARKGDIAERNGVYAAGVGAVSYDFPLGRRITLTPEVSYHRGLTEILKDSAWKMHEIRLGASIRFRFGVPALPVTDTPPDVPGLAGTVNASALLEGDVEQPIAQMRVEEFLSSELRPLLNYVFFDDGSSQLPQRYMQLNKSAASRFTTDDLRGKDVLPTYYQILNVIGWRMQKHPDANLTITGCNSDQGAEKGMTDLSRSRAESVRNYLRDVWGIPEGRMKVESRDLPAKPSTTTDPDGIAENRRVEIASNLPVILEPVFTTDTVRTTNPPTVRFHTMADAESGLRSWKLTASQGGRTLREFSGTGDVPATIDWGLKSEQSSIPRGTQPINYQLTLIDANGRSYSTSVGSLTIDQVTVQKKRQEKIADKETNRFSLILFDFGKSDISEANRRIVNFIKGRITPDAKVTITGYTDRVGEEDHNQRLSEERAQATARALGTAGAEVNGVGESVLLYNNDLPEGRFYCRVVNVLVEVPVVE